MDYPMVVIWYAASRPAQPSLAALSFVAVLPSARCSPSPCPPALPEAEEPHGFLETVRKHVTVTSTVPDNEVIKINMRSWWRRSPLGRSRRTMC